MNGLGGCWALTPAGDANATTAPVRSKARVTGLDRLMTSDAISGSHQRPRPMPGALVVCLGVAGNRHLVADLTAGRRCNELRSGPRLQRGGRENRARRELQVVAGAVQHDGDSLDVAGDRSVDERVGGD